MSSSNINERIKDNVVIINLNDNDLKKTINQIVYDRGILGNNSVSLYYENSIIMCLDYYFNVDNVIEFKKNICDIPINDLSKNNINLNDKLELLFNCGIGCSSGPSDLLLLLDELELFVVNNPIKASLVGCTFKIIILPFLKKFLMSIRDKCCRDILKKAINHKKEYTIDEFMRIFSFNEIKGSIKSRKKSAEILLSFYGYKYNKKTDTWIRK